MSIEENIKQELVSKFSYLADKIRIQRQRRIFLEVNIDNFFEIFDYAVKQLNFVHLSAITGLDEGVNLSAIYHLAQASGIMLNIKASVSREKPVLKTITPYFPGSDIYERELMDLLGFEIDALPPAHHYPLPDDWPQGEYPLRKDWRPSTKEIKKEANNA
ncbi:MAG: NADH-quinone oxidoreductase subunit C [Candidatus Omnitrophota bacterium]|nr:NADH-quinone oxidoreductase subunit C [Candidatus Omnitrophota bacterium]